MVSDGDINSSSVSAIKVSDWVCITYTHMQLPTVFLVYFYNFLILFLFLLPFFISERHPCVSFSFLPLQKCHQKLWWITAVWLESGPHKIPNIIHPGMMMLMMLVVNYSYSLMRNMRAFVVTSQLFSNDIKHIWNRSHWSHFAWMETKARGWERTRPSWPTVGIQTTLCFCQGSGLSSKSPPAPSHTLFLIGSIIWFFGGWPTWHGMWYLVPWSGIEPTSPALKQKS